MYCCALKWEWTQGNRSWYTSAVNISSVATFADLNSWYHNEWPEGTWAPQTAWNVVPAYYFRCLGDMKGLMVCLHPTILRIYWIYRRWDISWPHHCILVLFYKGSICVMDSFLDNETSPVYTMMLDIWCLTQFFFSCYSGYLFHPSTQWIFRLENGLFPWRQAHKYSLPLCTSFLITLSPGFHAANGWRNTVTAHPWRRQIGWHSRHYDVMYWRDPQSVQMPFFRVIGRLK